MKTLSLLVDAAEKLANDPKAPAAVVDWACMVYDQLNDGEERISVFNLRLLSFLVDSYEHGIVAIGYRIAIENNQSLDLSALEDLCKN